MTAELVHDLANQDAGTTPTREELLESIQALKHKELEPSPPEAVAEESEEAEEATEDEQTEDLAEAQDSTEDSAAPEEVLGKMSAADFAREVGISLEELYRDVLLRRGDEEVPISKVLDDYSALQTANAALTREREELAAKAQQAGVQAPAPGMSPQAQQLLAKAQTYQELGANPETYKGLEPGQAANARLEIRETVEKLVGQAQAIEQQHQMALRQQWAQVRAESDKQMRQKVLEWNDPKTMEAEQRQIKDMAATYGFQPQEIDAIYDPRARLMMRDLLKATQVEKQAKQGARKLKKLSKTLGTSARTPAKKTTLRDITAQLQDPSLTEAQRSKIRLTATFEE